MKKLTPAPASTARRPSIRNRLWRPWVTPPTRKPATSSNGLLHDAAQILAHEEREGGRRREEEGEGSSGGGLVN
jgi:hypothetical protein